MEAARTCPSSGVHGGVHRSEPDRTYPGRQTVSWGCTLAVSDRPDLPVSRIRCPWRAALSETDRTHPCVSTVSMEIRGRTNGPSREYNGVHGGSPMGENDRTIPCVSTVSMEVRPFGEDDRTIPCVSAGVQGGTPRMAADRTFPAVIPRRVS